MAHPLEALTVQDVDGKPVSLRSLWATRPAVLLFVRHFGCLFCAEQVEEMGRHLEHIRRLGADLAVIGNGTVDDARAFRDEHRLDFPVLTDPTREAYCAVGMRHGMGSVLQPRVLLRSLAALAKGFRQSRIAGDPLQQGGVIVMAADGREVYRAISRFAGDHPAPARVLAALEAAAR